MWGMEFLQQNFSQRVGLTLLHFLWEGILVAILLWGVVHLLRLKRGNQRYAAYLIGFLILLACPVVTFFTVDVKEVNRMSRRAKMITDMQVELQNYESHARSISGATSEEMIGMRGGRSAALARATVRFRDQAAVLAETTQPWMVGIWLVGISICSFRMIFGLIGFIRCRRGLEVLPEGLRQQVGKLSKQLEMKGEPRVFGSEQVYQAVVVGFLRPMVLLPTAMIAKMPVDLLEAVIAHELAHLRRFDLWVNLLQRVTETVLFFHPAVWWISQGLRREREMCCDELAARALGERLTYARALEHVSRAVSQAKEPVYAAALGQRRKTLLARVQHVLGLTGTPSHTGQAVMLILALVLVVLPLTTWALMAQGPSRILYVDDDVMGNNDGSSWEHAYNDLQDALDDAISGDEIRVAQGTYKPDQGGGETPGDRNATFALKNGVTIYGGFPDTGNPTWEDRDPNQYETILSGDLLGNDVTVEDPYDLVDHPSRTDNSLHVVVGHDTDETAVLDGFTITGGNCDQLVYQDPVYTHIWNGVGAGMYNVNGSPTLRDCTFRENSAGSDVNQRYGAGAGMTNIDNSHPTLVRCRFNRNTLSGYGDDDFVSAGCGMFNTENCNPTLLYCSFIENSSGDYGSDGAMVNMWGSSPTILHCEFRENQGRMGGAMANWDPGTNPVISHCTFINNRATRNFGAMRNNVGAKPTITNCLFQGNSAGRSNGAIHNYQSDPVIKNCLFLGNTASRVHGAIGNNQSNAIIENCLFKDNAAYGGGAAIGNILSNPVIRNCRFEGNAAKYIDSPQDGAWKVGGAIGMQQSSPTIEDCVFIDNSAELHGGAIRCSESFPTITRCVFHNNSTPGKGGAVHTNQKDGATTLINCTISQNSAGEMGGGIANESTLPLTLINCIVWGNTAPQGPQISGSATVTYSDIEGGWLGEGNIDEDPGFADPNNADYHLQSQVGRWDPNDNSWVCDGVTSPCIDEGDPAVDYANELWPHGGCVNMGGYGNTPEASMSAELIGNIADLNHDGMVNLEDYSFWVMNWMKEEILLAADLDRNGKVDLPDAVMFFDNWLWEEE